MDKQSVIVLTTGLSGSSLFSKLLVKAGFWCGDSIIKNNFSGHYNTYENGKLVSLNQALLAASNVDFGNQDQFNLSVFTQIEALTDQLDLTPYLAFIENCDQHQPWVLKDPRFIHTLGFWLKLMDFKQRKFIYVARKPWWLWVSFLNKRRLVDYSMLKLSEQQSIANMASVLKAKGIVFKLFYYEQLIDDPKATLATLNAHLGSDISVADFKHHCHQLPSRYEKWKLQIKAVLIYLKNYNLVSR